MYKKKKEEEGKEESRGRKIFKAIGILPKAVEIRVLTYATTSDRSPLDLI